MVMSLLPDWAWKGFDKMWAAGVQSPGVVRIKEVAREYVWDMKQAPGAAGENMTFKGVKNVVTTLEFLLLGDPQIEEWESWVALWDLDPQKKEPSPVVVYHPLLEERGVFFMSPKKIHAPSQSRPGDNLWIAKIEAIEWKPPPAANVAKSPSSAQAGARTDGTSAEAKAGGPPAETARQREIRELTQKFKDA